MNSHVKGALLIVVAMIMFSLNGVFVRSLGLDPGFILWFTAALALIFLLGLFAWKNDWKNLSLKKHGFLLILSGVLVVVNVFSLFKAYTLTTFSNAVLTHYLAPIIAALFAPFFLKEKLEKITIASLILGIIGMYLITNNNLSFQSQHFLGIIFGSISGFAYGFLIIAVRKLSLKKVPVRTTFLYHMLITSILMIPFIPWGTIVLTSIKVYLLILQTIITLLIPGFLVLTAYKFVKAQHGGIIAYTEVLGAILWGYLIFKEVPGVNTILGGALIILGGCLVVKDGVKK